MKSNKLHFTQALYFGTILEKRYCITGVRIVDPECVKVE